MKKASNIMYLVNMILCFILAGVLFLYGIGAIVVGCIPGIQDAIKEGLQEVPEEYRQMVISLPLVVLSVQVSYYFLSQV